MVHSIENVLIVDIYEVGARYFNAAFSQNVFLIGNIDDIAYLQKLVKFFRSPCKIWYAVNKEKGKWRLFVFIRDNFHREFFRLDLLVTHDLAVDVLRRVISDIIPVLFYDVGADGFSFREGNFIVEHNNT